MVIYNGTTINDYNVISSMPKSSNEFWNIAVENGVINQEGGERVREDEIPKVKSHSMMMLYDE